MYFHHQNLKSKRSNLWFKPWFNILLQSQSKKIKSVFRVLGTYIFWQNYEFMFFENFKQLRLFLCSETNHCIKQAYFFFCFLRTFLLQSTKFSNFIKWSPTSGNRLQLLGKVARITPKLLRYINNRGFTKFGIKVLWRLQFFIGYRTLNLKFQKARTKIEVVLSLSS